MDTTLKLVGMQIAWWTCTAAYLTSPRQRLRPRPLGRVFGWGSFAVGGVVCVAALSAATLHPIAATTYWLSVVMSSWLILVMALPHASKKAHVLASGTLLVALAALMG